MQRVQLQHGFRLLWQSKISVFILLYTKAVLSELEERRRRLRRVRRDHKCISASSRHFCLNGVNASWIRKGQSCKKPSILDSLTTLSSTAAEFFDPDKRHHTSRRQIFWVWTRERSWIFATERESEDLKRARRGWPALRSCSCTALLIAQSCRCSSKRFSPSFSYSLFQNMILIFRGLSSRAASVHQHHCFIARCFKLNA